MSDEPEDSTGWTVLAHLLRPQGRKGELLADLLTDFPERFQDRTSLFIAPPGFAGPPSAARAVDILSHWLPVGRNHGRIVLCFQGIDSIERAETLAGLDVIIPVSRRAELDDDTEYISDLIGCLVLDGAHPVGTVTGVEFPSSPDGTRRLAEAAPLLTVVTEEGDEILIPYVESFLVALSTERKRIEMQLPEGLLELNRPASN